MRILAVLISLFLLVGCTNRAPAPKGDKDNAQVKSESDGNEPDPAKNQDPLLAEIDAMKPVDAVLFTKLLPFLPPAPEGFTAEKADGATIEADKLKHSVAERRYRKGDQTVHVLITDGGNAKEKYQAFASMVNLKVETPDTYTKGLTIDGNRGWETYQKSDRSGNANLLVGKRYIVHVSVVQCDAALMHAVLKSIDLKGLAALK